MLRILAYKLETEGELVLASRILEQVLAMRPEEPQSYRDLTLVLDRQGEFRRAAELLWALVIGEWDGRFPQIETIALMELNRVLDRAGKEGQVDLSQELGIDQRLVKQLYQVLRVVLSWDVDLTDVDLWVTEPNGEKCFYSRNQPRMGGHISPDFTQGYGPEEYVVWRGMSGQLLHVESGVRQAQSPKPNHFTPGIDCGSRVAGLRCVLRQNHNAAWNLRIDSSSP